MSCRIMSADDERATKLAKAFQFSKNLRSDRVPAEIRPGLFLGSLEAVKNSEFLKIHGVTTVLSLTGLVSSKTAAELLSVVGVAHHVVVPIADTPKEDLLAILPQCFDAISRGIAMWDPVTARGGILVHCVQGRSRSPAVVVAFLMKTEEMTFDAALHEVSKQRTGVALNPGFANQLRSWKSDS